MSLQQPEAAGPPRGHVRVVYLGPVAPHWRVDSDFGDRNLIEEFRQRILARLLLLPPHDPQFRRNRERIVRDAERENVLLEWDLGVPEDEEDEFMGSVEASLVQGRASQTAPAIAPRAASGATSTGSCPGSTSTGVSWSWRSRRTAAA